MLIDPKSRRRVVSHAPKGVAADLADVAEVNSLLLELAPLRTLAWQPLAARVERLVDALRGGEGVTRATVDQLRTWSHRWGSLRPELRDFYATHADDPAATAALWRILDGGDRLRGPLRGQLDRLWIADHGAECPFQLVPLPSR